MIVILMIIIILPCMITKNNTASDIFGNIEYISGGWRYADGSNVNISKLKTNKDSTYSIFHDIPPDLPSGTSFCFSSRNISTQVYIGGNLVDSTPEIDNNFYNKSPGTVWYYIDIPYDAYNGYMEIRIKNIYEKNCSSIDNISFAQPANVIISSINQKYISVIIGVIMVFIGCCFMIIDLYAHIKIKKHLDVFFLGLFSILISVWCTLETGIMQVLLYNSRSIQLLEMYLLMLLPIPLMYYTRSYLKLKSNLIMNLICSISVITFILCTIFNILDIADLQETLILVHLNLLFSGLTLIVKILERFIKNFKEDSILLYIGFFAIMSTSIIDVIRYYIGNKADDAALFIRMGLVVFILSYGIVGMQSIMNKAKLGIKNEFVHRLAYQDGLTGIGNRTAYKEHIKEYVEKKTLTSAIVIFDVNNLKSVNDSYGHGTGDSIIMRSAKIIKQAFDVYGTCYRIGGDEFAVLIDGDNVKRKYKNAIELFCSLLDEENLKSKYKLSIAYGMAIYNENEGKSFEEISKIADELMYNCKTEMKKRKMEITA